MLRQLVPIMIAAGLAVPAFAQTAAAPEGAQTTGPSAGAAPMGSMTSDALLERQARNAEGQELGSIDNLVIDPQTGRITHLVVSVGGFLGIGDKDVAVPWEDVNFQQQTVVLNVTREELETAQAFKEQAAEAPGGGDAPVPTQAPADR